MSQTPELVTLGETMGLLAAEEIGPLRNGHHLTLGIAGAESNVAVGVRRLGHSAAWIGRVGADPVGAVVLRELRAEGVDVSHAIVDSSAANGFMLKIRRTTATSEVNYWRRGSAGSLLCADDVPADLVAGARIAHVTGITLALSETTRAAVLRTIEIARSNGVLVSIDVNHRATLWPDAVAATALRDVIGSCDFVFASENEAALLVPAGAADDMARALTKLGPAHAIVKRGELGCAAHIDGESLSDAAADVPVADPVGAGDAFVAGYLASWLDAATPTQCLRAANLAGAFAVAVPGDWEGAPTRDELAKFARRTDAVSR